MESSQLSTCVLLLCCLLLIGCSESGQSNPGDDASDASDADQMGDATLDTDELTDQSPDSADVVPDSSAEGPLPPVPPNPRQGDAELPRADCPEGWAAETDEDGVTVCNAAPYNWPTPACPAGPWPDTSDAGNVTVIYVSESNATDGSGTFVDPYNRLDLALTAIGPQDTAIIALSSGTYAFGTPIQGNVEIRGLCALETYVTPAAGAGALADQAQALLRFVTLNYPLSGSLMVQNGAELEIEDARITGPDIEETRCITVSEASLSVRRSHVRCPRAVISTSGTILFDEVEFAAGGSPINAADSTIEFRNISTVRAGMSLEQGNGRYAIGASRGTLSISQSHLTESLGYDVRGSELDLSMTDVVIADTQPQSNNEATIELIDVTATFARVRAEGCTRFCIRASGSTSLQMEDSVFGGNVVDANPPNSALILRDGSTTTARRVVVRDYRQDGISTTNGSVTLEDFTTFRGSGNHGAALRLWGVSNVQRARLIDPEGGIVVVDPRSQAVLEDIYIEGFNDAGPNEAGGIGSGVNARDVVVRRAEVVSPLRVGLTATSGSALTAEDVVIRSPVDPAGQYATGVISNQPAQDGFNRGQLTLRRARIENMLGYGIWIQGTDVVLSDVEVVGVADSPVEMGRGIAVTDGATVSVERMRLAEPGTTAFVVYQAEAQATDLEIDGQCELDTSCTPAQFGLFSSDAAIDVENFNLHHLETLAAGMDSQGSFFLTDGRIADSPIGLNIQVLGVELEDVTENVVFERVDAIIDRTLF